MAISTNFLSTTCPKCRASVWVGLNLSGFLIYLDIELLDIRKELIAKLTKRPTYEIHPTGVSFEVTPRIGAWLGKGAAIADAKVLATHRCDPILFAYPQEHPDYFNRKIQIQETDGIPF